MNIDFFHPYPRYGFAAALVQDNNKQLEEINTFQDVADLAISAIDYALNRFSVFTQDDPSLESIKSLEFDFVSAERLDPGKKSGQISAKGYFMAPYILTSDGSAANTVVEARNLRDALKEVKTVKDLYKPVKLKRSFAPLTAKVNNGNKSASEPPATLLQAAFTCIATLTDLKPSIYLQYEKGKYSNTGIIVDLPLYDVEGTNPLLDFVRLFDDMQRTSVRTEETMQARLDTENRKYRRPLLHQGNFPNRPLDYSLNAVSLVAAIGEWVKKNEDKSKYADVDFVKTILHHLAERPLYIISYEFAKQERFSHHLVEVALSSSIPDLQKAFYQSIIYGVEKKDDPKGRLFLRAATHFLQFFNAASFQNFMAFRAEYGHQLLSLFHDYFNSKEFMKDSKISADIIKSARAFGQSLNRAAFVVATKEAEEEIERSKEYKNLPKDNEKRVKKKRELEIRYKARILTELESRIFSASSHLQLLSQTCVTVGRMTGKDIDAEADLFMEEVAQSDNEKVSLGQAKNLITAFMRLRSSKAKELPHSTPIEYSNNADIEMSVEETKEDI